MSTTVCISASTIGYPQGGGHLWVFLNWALGLRSLGCRVLWLESVRPDNSKDKIRANLAALNERLGPYGLARSIALASSTDAPLPCLPGIDYLEVDAAAEAADLLLNLRYGTRPEVVARFRRSALVDIDPGLLQSWVHAGTLSLPHHDVYFTTGETVGRPKRGSPAAESLGSTRRPAWRWTGGPSAPHLAMPPTRPCPTGTWAKG
jgi:hypothetical protein